MLGHHLYNENKKRAILNNKKLPSYTILSIDLLNELLREKMSTGNLILSDERFDLKEIINFNQIIGKYISKMCILKPERKSALFEDRCSYSTLY